MTPPLILASKSTIRRDLLKNVGIQFTVQSADIDERALEDRLSGAASNVLAEALATAKAKAVSQANQGALVIGADQVLEKDGHHLHKAKDRQEAERKLKNLQGSTHHLIAAAVLVRDGQTLWQTSDRACLTMRPLSAEDRAAYLDRAGDAATQSVGAYRLEDIGATLFDRIEGDYFTILGLPLLPLLSALRDQGIDPLTESEPA